MPQGSQVLIAGVRTGVLGRIETHLETYSDAERRVAEVILSDPAKVLILPISAMAEACAVAQPTLSRFAKRVGLDSYPAMRLAIAHDLATSEPEGTSDRYEGLDRLYRALAADPSLHRIAQLLRAAEAVEIWATQEYGDTAHELAESLRAESLVAAASTTPTAWRKIAPGLRPGSVVLLLAHDEEAVWRIGLAAAREQRIAVVAIATTVPRGVHLDDVLVLPNVTDPRRSGIAVADALVGAIAALSPSGAAPGPASPRRHWRHTQYHVLAVDGVEIESILLHHPDSRPNRPLAIFFNGMRSRKEDGVPPGTALNRISPALTSSLLNADFNVLLIDNPGHGHRGRPWREPGEALVRSARGEGEDLLSLSRRTATSLIDAAMDAGLVAGPDRIAVVGQSWGALQALHTLVGDVRLRYGVFVIPICDPVQIRELGALSAESRVAESRIDAEQVRALSTRSLLFIAGSDDEVAAAELTERFAHELQSQPGSHDVHIETLAGVRHEFDSREGDLMGEWLADRFDLASTR